MSRQLPCRFGMGREVLVNAFVPFPMPLYAEGLIVLGLVRGEVQDYYYVLDTEGMLGMEAVEDLSILRPATPFDFKEKPKPAPSQFLAAPVLNGI